MGTINTGYRWSKSTRKAMLRNKGSVDVALKRTKKSAINLKEPDLNQMDGRLWSVGIRIQHWLTLYKEFLHNAFTIVFGAGSTFMYYESTILRILFGTGLFGLIYVIYFVRKVPLYFLSLLVVSGITLDLLLSF